MTELKYFLSAPLFHFITAAECHDLRGVLVLSHQLFLFFNGIGNAFLALLLLFSKWLRWYLQVGQRMQQFTSHSEKEMRFYQVWQEHVQGSELMSIISKATLTFQAVGDLRQHLELPCHSLSRLVLYSFVVHSPSIFYYYFVPLAPFSLLSSLSNLDH